MKNNKTQAISEDLDQIADDAQALIAATADVAGEKVEEARTRLSAALDRGKEIYDRVREKEFEGAQAFDATVHEHLYKTLAFGAGVGVLIGFLIARGCACKRD
jgi:ElaB/YqjD/DUF883 family membrane-anchored ribosome-binding protein